MSRHLPFGFAWPDFTGIDLIGSDAAWWQLIVTQLWQVTILVLVVAAISAWLRDRAAHLVYWLWVLVIIKSLLPPIIASPTSAFSVVTSPPVMGNTVQSPDSVNRPPATGQPSAVSSQQFAQLINQIGGQPRPLKLAGTSRSELPTGQIAAGTPATSIADSDNNRSLKKSQTGWTWLSLFALTWGGGLFAFVVVAAVIHLLLLRHMYRSCYSPPVPLADYFAELATELGVRCRVRLLLSRANVGPVVFGILRPTVVIPDSLVIAKTDEELEPILAHELIHVRRGDLVVGWLQSVAQACWWFHPLLWWSNRCLNWQRERCCDEEVLASLNCERSQYAQSLLDVLKLRRQLRPLFSPAMGAAEITTRRLKMIMNDNGKLRNSTPWWSWAIVLVVATLVLPGAGMRAEETPNAPRQTGDSAASQPKESRPEQAGPKRPETETVAANWLPNQGRTAWNSLRGGPTNPGVAAPLPPSELTLKWSFTAKDNFVSSAIAGDSLVFAADVSGRVYAIRQDTGKPRWIYVSKNGFFATPVLYGSKLICLDEDGRVISLDQQTGRLQWQLDVSANTESSPNLIGHRLVFTAGNGNVYCVDAERGKRLWTTQLTDQLRTTPAIDQQQVLVAGCDGKLHFLDLLNGKPLSEIEFGAPTGSSPTINRGHAFLGDEHGQLHGFSLSKRRKLWTLDVGKGSVRSIPIAYRDTVIASGVAIQARGNGVFAADRKTGNLRWTFTRERIDQSPVVAGDVVYAGTGRGRIFALDARTGKQLKRIEVGGQLNDLTLGNGQLWVTNKRGKLLAFATSGQTGNPTAVDQAATPQATAAKKSSRQSIDRNPPAGTTNLGSKSLAATATSPFGQRSQQKPERTGNTNAASASVSRQQANPFAQARNRQKPSTTQPIPDDIVSLIDLADRYAKAKADIERRKVTLDYSTRLAQKGFVDQAQLNSDRQAVHLAESKLNVMTKMISLAIRSTERELLSWRKHHDLTSKRIAAGQLDPLKLHPVDQQLEKIRLRLELLREVIPAAKTEDPSPKTEAGRKYPLKRTKPAGTGR